MKLKPLIAAASMMAAAISTPAAAVFLSSYSGGPGNLVADFSSAGFAAINLDIVATSTPTLLNFVIEAGDIGGPLAFNAVVTNLFGGGIERFLLTLDNATFSLLGSVETSFGSVPSAAGGGATAGINFAPPDFFGFTIGDPFLSGAQDWAIDTSGLSVGDTFSLRMLVPEPGTLPLVVAGLLLASRRRAGGSRR